MSDTSPENPVDPAQVLLDVLPGLELLLTSLAHRHGLDPDEAQDFASFVKERLIENDYARLRKHRGESTMLGYLGTVVPHLYLDFRVKQLGRWRPSAGAKRLGPVAVRLQALLEREGMGLEQAIEMLRSRGVNMTDGELRRLAAQLPRNANPRKHDRALPLDACSPDHADDGVLSDERQQAWQRVQAKLARAMAQLPNEDQILLRLRVWEHMHIPDIARALNLTAKPLYRRLERIVKRLRVLLRADGVDAETVRELLSDDERVR